MGCPTCGARQLFRKCCLCHYLRFEGKEWTDSQLFLQYNSVELFWWGSVISFKSIELVHDTRHLCRCFRTDGIKAMSRVISGNKQAIKSATACNRSQFFLSQRNGNLITMQSVQFEFRQDLCHCLLWGWSLLHPKQLRMITSILNLPLSS